MARREWQWRVEEKEGIETQRHRARREEKTGTNDKGRRMVSDRKKKGIG